MKNLVFAILSAAALSACAARGDDKSWPIGDGVRISFSIGVGEIGKSNRVVRTITAADMKTVRAETDGDRTRIVWSGGDATFGPGFEVTAELTRAGDREWDYGFSFRGSDAALPLEVVRFPVVEAPRDDRTAIFYPNSSGVLYEPVWKDLKPGQSVARARPRTIHFLSSLDADGGGWYVDQRGDARLRTTVFRVFNGRRPGSVVLESSYETPCVPTRDFTLPYGGRIARLRGRGWYAAARHYGDWARRQDWYAKAKARDLSTLRDIGMWFWNREAVANVLPPVERFQRDAGVPCALDWYWWHAIPYDMCFPNFWPPREGEAAFRAAVERCRRQGIFLQVYTNGMTWDMDDASWTEGGAEGVRRKPDGTALARAFNRFSGHRLAYMCGDAEKYQARMRDVCRKLTAAGLPGIYLDMIGYDSYDPCYATTHSHAPGGGAYQVGNYRRFVEAVHRDNPGVLLSTEDVSEAYLDVFESGICLCCNYERFEYLHGADNLRYVPAGMAVYHGTGAFFGSFAMVHGVPAFDPKWPSEGRWKVEKDWKSLFPDQFAVEFTRGVSWGLQPMVHNFRPGDADDPRYAEDYRLMIDTARFYHANRDLLFDGEMLDPGTIDCDRVAADFMVRSTYAREGEYKTVRRTNLPAAFHSVWRAPDGKTAAVLANWTRQARTYRLVTPDIVAEGILPARSWLRISK